MWVVGHAGAVTATASGAPASARRAGLPSMAVVAAAVAFGTTGTAQALGPDGTTPLGLGTARIAVGAAALWCFAARMPSLSVLRAHRWLFVLGAVGVAGYQPAFFAGTARSGVALGTVVALGSGPVFAGVIEWVWLRRRPSRRWAVATAVTVVGGVLLVLSGTVGDGLTATGDRPGADAADVVGFEIAGIAASLGAGLSYAVYAIAAKLLITRGVHSTVSLAWPFTLGAVMLAPVAVGEPFGWVTTGSGIVMLAHLGIVTVGLAYFLYGWGLRAMETSNAVTLTLAEPVTAALLAVVLLDERLRPGGWFGIALVIVGLAMVGGVRPSWRGWGRRGAPRSASSDTGVARARRAPRRRVSR